MNQSRRTLLKATLSMGAVAVATSAGLLTPRAVLAANWPSAAFDAKTIEESLQTLLGNNKVVESKDVMLDAPDIAEDGSVVSIGIDTTIKNADSLMLFVPKNNRPLTAIIGLSDITDPGYKIRIKMAKSSPVTAVVKANGKLYSATKNVKVTLGGCGG